MADARRVRAFLFLLALGFLPSEKKSTHGVDSLLNVVCNALHATEHGAGEHR